VVEATVMNRCCACTGKASKATSSVLTITPTAVLL
jgi:hypothetical protein